MFVLNGIVGLLGQCLRLLGAQQTEFSGRLHEVFMEEYRNELLEIKSPTAKRLLVLAKTGTLVELAIGEYTTLIAIAEMTRHLGVGALLDGCVAENTAFVKRIKRLIASIVEGNGTVTRSTIHEPPHGGD